MGSDYAFAVKTQASSSREVERVGLWPQGLCFNPETFRDKQGVDMRGRIVIHLAATTVDVALRLM